jgi:hypothetical protein
MRETAFLSSYCGVVGWRLPVVFECQKTEDGGPLDPNLRAEGCDRSLDGGGVDYYLWEPMLVNC